MEKAPDAFRTISEVAEDLDVPQHVLRFWETRFAQIRPLKRGGGRRYYRPDDIDFLRGIRHLLYGRGYTIKGVQRIIRDEGLRSVQNVWREGTVTEMIGSSRPDNMDTVSDGVGDSGTADPINGGSDDSIDPIEDTMSPDAIGMLSSALTDLRECRRVLQTLQADADTMAD